jgi:hypothetical protein
MLFRSPAVRRRWRGIRARAHPMRDAFTERPLASSLAFISMPAATRAALFRRSPHDAGQLGLEFPTPAVHHVETISPRQPLPAVLRGRMGEALIAMVRARTSEEAIAIGHPFAQDASPVQGMGEALDRALGAAMGAQPSDERWGEDATVDWLRARQLDRLGTDLAATRWLGVLSWLARHAEHWHAVAPKGLEFMKSSPPLMTAAAFGYLPIASTALARANGSLAALRAVIGAFEGYRLAPDWPAQVRKLVLRCALAGAFVPGSLKHIVPKPRAKRKESVEAWQALLLTRRALLGHGQVMGAAHLTAALVATDVRRCMVRELRDRGHRVRIPGWGSRAMADKEVEALRTALYERGLRLKRWHAWMPPPWPDGWGGPDAASTEGTIARLIDGDTWMAAEILLHDGLAVAAVLALGGHAANAIAVLGATRTPPSLARTRSALARAIHRNARSNVTPPDRPWGNEADAIDRQLRKLPEPSLAIDAPYWLLRDQRAQLQHALQTRGRLQEFRDLRLILDRPDVAAKLAPFWLLREDETLEESLIGLVHTIGRQLDPPSRDQCLHYLRSRL